MSDESKIFSIVGQGLKLDTKADIQPHLEKLEQITDLEEVHLGGNTLGVEACQALADVLKNKKTLKVADFADIFTGRLISEIPDALRALCDALTDHTNLVELNLSDNAFGGRSAEPMVNFLKNNHSFSVLKLNNNGLGITGGTIVAEALFEAAQNLKAKGLESQLRTVICGRNRLENGSAPVWAKAYAAHGGLVEVRMFQNGIRMEGIEAISKGLASCPNLEVLDLQDNTATLRGSRAIAACLPKWPKLKTLNLSDCLLKPKGGALVFGALADGSNPALETIQVQYCDLDRKVLDRLGTAIELHLTSLTTLDINGNWADEEDECIEKIKSALAKHGHEDALLELDEMDPEGEESEGEEEEDEEDEDAEEDQETKPAAPEAKPDETDELVSALGKTSVADEQNAVGAPESEAPEAQRADESAAPAVPAAVLASEPAVQEAVVTPVVDETETSQEQEAAAGTVVEQDPEEPIEPVGEATSAAVDPPASEEFKEQVTDSVNEPGLEATSEPSTEQTKQNVEEPVTEAATEEVKEPHAEYVQEPATEQTNASAEQADDAKDEVPATEETAEQTSGAPAATSTTAASAEDQQANIDATNSATSDAPLAVDAPAAQADPSVDLAGELFSKDAAAETTSTPASAQINQQTSTAPAPARKRGFRAAWGAIRELLK